MRIMYKVSGESIKDDTANISKNKLELIMNNINKLLNEGNEVIVVVGGGNIYRGRDADFLDFSSNNNIGMLATVMNAVALNSFLNINNVKSVILSAFEVSGIAQKYDYNLACRLIKNNVIIMAGGLGIPTFSTDMVTIEKAIELSCDLILIGKYGVDGVYDKNPKSPDAKKYDYVTHNDLLKNQIEVGVDKLGVIDFEAMALLCRNPKKIYVYNANDPKAIDDFLNKKYTGTIIESK